MQTIISFDLTSTDESKILFERPDASNIDKVGYMIYKPSETGRAIKVKGVYLSDKEITNVVSFMKEKNNYYTYENSIVFLNNNEKDALFDKILNYAIEKGQISESLIQKKFNIDYNRASRIIDIFEEQGIVSKKDKNKIREVLVKYED